VSTLPEASWTEPQVPAPIVEVNVSLELALH
jgi:hypothetical protein